MIAMIVGAIVGVAAGIAAEPVVRRLPAAVEDATQQPPWTRAIRRPPVMELVGAALGALVGYRIGWHGALVPSLVLVAAVVPIVFIDLEHRVIPNRIVLPGTAVALAVWAAVDHTVLSEHALAAAAGFGLFLGMALIYPAGMGLGDVKLALMLGAFLGWSVLAGVVVAFVASAIPSVIVLIVKGKEGRKATIPFGPFLAGGGVVALLWGPALVDWYLGKH